MGARKVRWASAKAPRRAPDLSLRAAAGPQVFDDADFELTWSRRRWSRVLKTGPPVLSRHDAGPPVMLLSGAAWSDLEQDSHTPWSVAARGSRSCRRKPAVGPRRVTRAADRDQR
eukprot:TRINITY_DN61698_c0_g1_i1.p2 TRINITY_DN61698_c0_g1~~TRINITY_DN61698_c0_g1_i1.p2  ORF type:complete len:115 (+),score=11.57 TRINITY_DN61698_c0_g1_i1:349-693(+)